MDWKAQESQRKALLSLLLHDLQFCRASGADKIGVSIPFYLGRDGPVGSDPPSLLLLCINSVACCCVFGSMGLQPYPLPGWG